MIIQTLKSWHDHGSIFLQKLIFYKKIAIFFKKTTFYKQICGVDNNILEVSMSMTVNKTDNSIVKKMTLTGAATGTLVALHKAGKINTAAADAFIRDMGNAIKNGDKTALKDGGKKLLDGAKRIKTKVLRHFSPKGK